jgi:hypothetical protein
MKKGAEEILKRARLSNSNIAPRSCMFGNEKTCTPQCRAFNPSERGSCKIVDSLEKIAEAFQLIYDK